MYKGLLRTISKSKATSIFTSREFNKKCLDSKHVFKVNFKPSRKNSDIGFLPLPSKPVWLKNDHLTQYFYFTTKLRTEKVFSVKGCAMNDKSYVLCI